MDQVRDSQCTHTALLMVYNTVQRGLCIGNTTHKMRGTEFPCVLVRVTGWASKNTDTATV